MKGMKRKRSVSFRGRVRECLSDERGSMSLVTVFTLAVVLIGSVFLFYFFTVYIEKRQAQNIADAASLVAAQTLSDKYEEQMQHKAEEAWTDFKTMLEEELALMPEDEKSSIEEIAADKYLQKEVLLPFLNGTKQFDRKEDWLLIVQEPYFQENGFSARQNGDMLYDTYRQHASVIQAAVRTTIALNHGKETGELTFPIDRKPKLILEAAAVINIDKIDLEKDIRAAAASSIGSKNMEIDVSTKPPLTVSW